MGGSAIAMLAGCAQTPMGPTVNVMPAANKPFEVFQQDQAVCKSYAQQQVAGQADNANQRAVGGALLGTALGAGLGAAVGGGHGAGVGAATGAVAGTAVGASTSGHEQMSIQQQYNTAYLQCMYSRGNQVPGYQTVPQPVPAAPVIVAPPPPPPSPYPPPPPGAY